MDSSSSLLSVTDLRRTRCVCVCVYVCGLCEGYVCEWYVCMACVCMCVWYVCVCGMSACGVYVWIVCDVGGLRVCVCGVCCGMGALVWFVYMLTVMWKDYYPSVSLRGYWCALTYVSFFVRGDKSVA